METEVVGSMQGEGGRRAVLHDLEAMSCVKWSAESRTLKPRHGSWDEATTDQRARLLFRWLLTGEIIGPHTFKARKW